MPGKTSLRDKLDEDVLDLSLMQLSEVPVTDIVSTIIYTFAIDNVNHKNVLLSVFRYPQVNAKSGTINICVSNINLSMIFIAQF